MMLTQRAALARRVEVNAGPDPATVRPTIVVVEDEEDLRELLRYNLERDGFRVLCLASGEQAVRSIKAQQPDLVLLDLMLPGMDGLSVCRLLKGDPNTAGIPIVMLTAKGEEADVVAGLELGADDYVTKPFSPRVLLARIKAVQRRQSQPEPTDDFKKTVIRAGELMIRTDRHEVVAGEQVFDLTASEFRLLCLLANQPGRVYSRRQIVQKIHGELAAVTDRSVDVLVMGVRRKIEPYGHYIQTVRGVGYRYKD